MKEMAYAGSSTLDGTTNFIHGIPCYCISIGLFDGNKGLVGVVHELNLDECFYASADNGAYLNGEPIRTSNVPSLADSLIATGFPYHDYDRMKPYMEVFDHCMRHTRGLRRLGSAAADLAYVAAGRFEVLRIWIEPVGRRRRDRAGTGGWRDRNGFFRARITRCTVPRSLPADRRYKTASWMWYGNGFVPERTHFS